MKRGSSDREIVSKRRRTKAADKEKSGPGYSKFTVRGCWSI